MQKILLFILGSLMLFVSACSNVQEDVIEEEIIEEDPEEKSLEEEITLDDSSNHEIILSVEDNQVFINGITLTMPVEKVRQILGEPDDYGEGWGEWHFDSEGETGIVVEFRNGTVFNISMYEMAGKFDDALKLIGFDVNVTDAMFTYDEAQLLQYFYHPRIDSINLSFVEEALANEAYNTDTEEEYEEPIVTSPSLKLTLQEFQKLFNEQSMAAYKQFNSSGNEIKEYPVSKGFKVLQDGFFYEDFPSFSFVGELNSDKTIRWIALRIPIVGGVLNSEDPEAAMQESAKNVIQQMMARQGMVHAVNQSINIEEVYEEIYGQQYVEFMDVAEVLIGDYKIIETSSEDYDIFLILTADDEIDLVGYI